MFSLLLNWDSLESVSNAANRLQMLAVTFTLLAALFAVATYVAQKRVDFLRKPRTLTKQQINTIIPILKKNKGVINFRSPSTDAEADKYTYQLSCLFKDSGWKVESHLFSFEMSHLSGLAVLVNGKSTQKILEQAIHIVDAFALAGISVKKYQDDKENLNKLTILVCHKNI